VHVNGSVENNGVVQNNTSSHLRLYISGDITNNAKWDNSYITFNGTGQQLISLLPGKTFGSSFTNNNTADTIKATTDLLFTDYFNLSDNILDLNHHNIRFTGADTYFGDGIIVSPNEFLGTINIDNDTHIEGNLIITDTLQNRSNIFTSLHINGSIENNGVVQNNTSRYLRLYLSGDITNNGKWDNSYTTFNGTGQQLISLLPGKTFGSSFTNNNTSDTVRAISDLLFTDYFDLSNNILDLNHHNIRFTGADTYFGDGTIVSPNEFLGTINIDDVTYIEGSLIITDTLQNKSGDYGFLHVNGSIENNGVVTNNTSSYLRLYISGDITNKGIWENDRTYLEGNSDQTISMQDGSPLNSEVFFNCNFGNSPYQWYYDNTILNSPDFTGETSQTLTWEVPVSPTWYGTFYCETGSGNSRNIIVGEGGGLRLDVKAFFEGPYNGTGMNTDIYPWVPDNQPYNVYPWEYDGGEMVEDVPENAVDWLLVELRDAADVNSANFDASIGGQAAFILDDGSVVDLGGEPFLSFNYTINQNLFIVLWHRNHLPVLSNYALTQSGGTYTYDFTTAVSQAYGNNQSDLGGDKFGMIAGDLNADGTINEFDLEEQWNSNAGKTGYFMGDGNMDSQVNNKDKNDVWHPNKDKTEIFP